MDWTFIKKESDLHNVWERFDEPLSLENFEFGKAIAKGCNGVVYTAKLKKGMGCYFLSSSVVLGLEFY